VGFYDVSIVDSMQIRALKCVIELEQNLLLDKTCNKLLAFNPKEKSSEYSDESDNDIYEKNKYEEMDDPELKFCPYCPARFFFRSDVRCHIRFHKYRGWSHACECCSFNARSAIHISSHEVVHSDEYEQRTSELLASGYPVNQRYPRPLEYLAPDLPQQTQRWLKCDVKEKPDFSVKRKRRIKRPCFPDGESNSTTALPSTFRLQTEHHEKTNKRRRRSTIIAETSTGSSLSSSSPTKTGNKVQTGIAMKTNSPNTTTKSITTKITNIKSIKDTSVKTPKSAYIRQFKCDMCPGQFFKLTALQYHKTLHGGSGIHQCRKCDYAVSTYGNLIRHESVHRDLPPREKIKCGPLKHKVKINKKSIGNKTTTMPAPLPPPPLPLTSNSTSNETMNNEDIQIDPEFGTSMLGNPNFYYPTTIKNGVAQPRRYKCEKCPSAFDKREQYAVHLTLHGASDKYKCDKCDYAVRYVTNYVQHQRKHLRDAEIRKNNEQAIDRAKMIAAQEKESEMSRLRRKQTKSNVPKLINLEPRDTVFLNEISDQQTAYELNAAYGDTGFVENGAVETSTVFRCNHCPYEGNSRSLLDRHLLHHQVVQENRHSTDAKLLSASLKRAWKRKCRFCTYRTHGDNDLTEHTRVHFLRSNGAVLSSLAMTDINVIDSEDPDFEDTDHIEYHGKRVVYHQQKRHRDKDKVSDDCSDNDEDDEVAGEVEEEAFSVFKDRGAESQGEEGKYYTGKIKRFSPTTQPPPVLIDYNDNRTMCNASDGTTQNKPLVRPAFVRFIDDGKELEFVEKGRPETIQVGTVGRKRRSK